MGAVFRMMDDDDSGVVDYREFVEMLQQFKTQNSHTLLVMTKYWVLESRKEVKELLRQFWDAMMDSFQQTEVKLRSHMLQCSPKARSQNEQLVEPQQTSFQTTVPLDESPLKPLRVSAGGWQPASVPSSSWSQSLSVAPQKRQVV